MSTTIPHYTPKQVRAWLIIVWGYDPRAKFEGRPLLTVEARNWPALYLPRREHNHLRDVVTAWAWCMGAKEKSFRRMCLDRDWDRSTALREVERATRIIAEGLNRDAARAAAAPATSTINKAA